jgi:transcriptional regulator with PAS, ATPase and Fis domain
MANNGTIFLDEIAEMTPTLQAKLLRVAQDGRFQRIGSNKEIHTNARILAASNRNLEDEVKAGRFREDLYYRLNVVELELPPLRERREDILPFANLFISQLARNKARLADATADCLQNYPWPGNVRELRNAIERAVLLSQSELVMPEQLPTKLREAAKQATPVMMADTQTMDEIERQAILAALAQHKHNRTETAKALGISRRTLLYKLQRLRQQGFQFE